MYGDTVSNIRQQCGPYHDQVKRITGLTIADLSRMIWSAGMDYLQSQGLEHYASCQAFWNDFSYYWYARDGEYVAMSQDGWVLDYWDFHMQRLKGYYLDQAVITKAKKQLKAEAYG